MDFIKKNWPLIFANLLAVTAICIAYCRCKPLEIDWVGVLVGVLTILVTVLIGWNIWSLFDFNKEKTIVEKMSSKLENLRNESKIFAKKNRAQTNEAVSDLYNTLLFDKKDYDKNFRFYQYLMTVIDAIRLRSEVDDFDKCSKIIEEFLRDAEKFDSFSLTNDNIEEIKRVYNLIIHRNEIKRLAELDVIMYNILYK